MLVGRNKEITRLEKTYQSSQAELVVLYGRRRIGKTFLIRYFFEEKQCPFFQATGLQKGSLKKQLEHFAEALAKTFTNNIPIKEPTSWDDAFKTLTQFIETADVQHKVVIFLDELPWMATRRSGLLEALDYYWNQHWSRNSNIIVIICGSSASWLINNIIYNKAGLHNRCTCEIKLEPFNLSETEAFLQSRHIKLNRQHILEIYMALGGVPYYLKYIEPDLTATENIQAILFAENAPLKEEFKKLFSSLFVNPDAYIELIKLISEKKGGVERAWLESKSKLSPGGGRLTERLTQLEQTNFINTLIPAEKQRGEYYKVIDEFCLFYMSWLSNNGGKKLLPDHWLRQTKKPIYHVWAGYAFEAVCHKHMMQIIKKLNILTAESISAWRLTANREHEQGAQIDFLVNRDDDAITIGEIKYTDDPFIIDKQYAETLAKKLDVFKNKTKTKKQLFVVLISANGLKKNQYSNQLISGLVTLEDLFT